MHFRQIAVALLLVLPGGVAQSQANPPAPQQFYPWSTVQAKCRNPPTEEGRMACRQQIEQDRAKDWGQPDDVFNHIIAVWRDAPQFLDRAFDEIAVQEPRYKCGTMAGEWKMPAALNWLETEFSLDWDVNLKKIQAWEAAAPRSPYPYLLEAAYWVRYAWDARGGGYAGTVTKEAWSLFGERMDRADAALEKSRAWGAAVPGWHAMKLRVSYFRNARDTQQIFAEATRRWPEYYSYYDIALTFTLPRWGGNADAIERLVRDSVRITRPTLGTTMYARLYEKVAGDQDIGSDLFTKTRANWPDLKASIGELIQRYPQGRYHNMMAMYACQARDRNATLTALEKMREQGIKPKWPGPHSSDSCIAWAEKLPAT